MLIDEAYVKAQNILLEHREKLDQLSTILMEKEVVSEQEIEKIFED